MTALEFVESLAAEGYRPHAVSIEPFSLGWKCRVSLADWVPLGEGDAPVSVDRDVLPEGIHVRGKERIADQCCDLPDCHSREVAETMIREVAEHCQAPEYAWLDGRWLCKPIRFLAEPLRSSLLRKHGLHG